MLTTAEIPGNALNSTYVLNNTWIINSGATDHMPFDSRHITTVTPSSHNFISTVNGDPIPVIGEGTVSLSDAMNLNSVLIVPFAQLQFTVCY